MGCGASNDAIKPIPYYTREEESEFLHIGIDYRELEQLSEVFRKFDPTCSRELDIVEFLIDVHLELNIMTMKIFNLIDGHADNSISFREFVLHSWYFLTMRSRELERFTFEIYDSDGKGTLSKHELHDVLVKIHGKKEVETKLASILELMDIDHNNGIDIDEFLCHIKKFPVLMFPVFAIQDTMRQYIIGESFWQAKEEDAIRYKETPVVQKMLARSFSHKHLHNIQPIKHHHLGSSTPDNSASRAHAGGKDPSHSRSKGSESNNDDNTSTLYRVGKGEETGAAKAPVKSPRKSVDEELEGSTSRSRSKTPRRSSTSTLPSDVACAPGPAPRRHSLTVDTVGGGQGSHARHHHEVGATPKHGHDTPKHGHDAASKHHHEVVTPKHGHDAKHNHSTSHGSINPGGPIIIKYK